MSNARSRTEEYLKRKKERKKGQVRRGRTSQKMNILEEEEEAGR